jgi:hypothetical protein
LRREDESCADHEQSTDGHEGEAANASSGGHEYIVNQMAVGP